ncbi:MAG: GIY-YIG nuclease family protein [Verrucomicrobiota bacterium]|nr:GIY-YIG nuclease family protein [Verrucomicrobiota bacterium]
MIEKARVLEEIRRIAKENGGKAPGTLLFERKTGIRHNDWFPSHWLRWGDALVEAGFSCNQMQAAYSADFLVEKFIAFARELGRIPVKGEFVLRSRTDKTFPSQTVFYRDGKDALLGRVVRYCESHPEYDDVLSLCRAELKEEASAPDKERSVETGFVYLMRSGRHHKIGRTVSVGSRERQLAIKIPVPPTTIHTIETDDPAGVEAYWHRRFASKRGEGEWFDLSSDDVAAFKRWKRIA